MGHPGPSLDPPVDTEVDAVYNDSLLQTAVAHSCGAEVIAVTVMC